MIAAGGSVVAKVQRQHLAPRTGHIMSGVSGVIDLECPLHPANKTFDPDHEVLDSVSISCADRLVLRDLNEAIVVVQLAVRLAEAGI